MTTRDSSKQGVRYAIVAGLLFLLLAGLAVFYYMLTRPPAVKEVSDRDRRYMFSIYGYEGDLLRRPSSLGIAENGDIYVADTGKKRVVVFDKDGNYVTTYGDFGDKPLQLWEPLGVAVAPDGRSYVLDKSKKKIVLFDAQKKATKAITFEEYPLSVRVANGSLFVTTESGILIGDLDGKLLTGYVARGKKPGQFDRPGAVAVGEDGTLYVADSLNYRVQAISTKGKPIWQYGQPLKAGATNNMTTDTGQKFGLPASITIDEKGYLYVVDGLNSEIVVLDAETGEFIEKMGDVGHDDGKFYYPDGIDYYDGRLVIADKYNDRVEVFRVPTAGVVSQWLPFAPWALLLLLIPVPFFFIRRGTRYVLTPQFVAVMAAAEEGATVAAAVAKAFGTAEVTKALGEHEALKLELTEREVADDSVSALVERYGLSTEGAEALDIAVKLKGKRVLLTEDEATTKAASDLGIATVTYEELARTLRKSDDKGKEKADVA